MKNRNTVSAEPFLMFQVHMCHKLLHTADQSQRFLKLSDVTV